MQNQENKQSNNIQPQSNRKVVKITLSVLVLVVLLAGAGYVSFRMYTEEQNTDTNKELEAGMQWNTYTNEQFNIQFDYPVEWEVVKKSDQRIIIYDPEEQEESGYQHGDVDYYAKFLKLGIESIPGVAEKYKNSPRFVYHQDFLDNKITLGEFVYRTVELVTNTKQPEITPEILDEYFKNSNLEITEKNGSTMIYFQREFAKSAVSTLVVITTEKMGYYLDLFQEHDIRNPEDDKMFEYIVDSFKFY